MLKLPLRYLLLCFLAFVFNAQAQSISSQPFRFAHGDIEFVGLLDVPKGKETKGLVVLIPGYGRTYVHTGKWNLSLRERLNEAGYATFAYDKAGCGGSGGTFDANQPVEDSAAEIRTAIQHLKEKNIKGSERVGLWGISRAGWIAPLVLANNKDIAFWISVSGPTHLDNTEYLIKSNWRSRGYSEEKIEKLITQWHKGFDIQRSGGTYQQYLDVTQGIIEDPFMLRLRGEYSEEKFLRYQSFLQKNPPKLDPETHLMVLVDDFESALGSINIPVLGIWGEKDSQVDWQAAYHMYQQKMDASFTGITLEQCNHLIRRCDTCEFGESQKELLEKGLGNTCEGYLDGISDWLGELSNITR